MVEEKKDLEGKFFEKIDLAHSELELRSRHWEELSKKVNLSKTSWLLPGISSPPNITHSLPPRPLNYTVIASDGSQIFPDRHEALPCYLINIGSVILHYGTGGKAHLKSYPKFFYGEEGKLTTWDGRMIQADSTVISEKRALMEFEEILRLLGDCKNKDNILALL